MTLIYVVLERGGALVGDFDLVEGVDLIADVRALKARIKVVRGADLAGIPPWHLTVFGPFGAKPGRTEVARLMEKEEPCDPAATLSTLVNGMERAYFIVRITAPPPAAAAGASVLSWQFCISRQPCLSRTIYCVLMLWLL